MPNTCKVIGKLDHSGKSKTVDVVKISEVARYVGRQST